jgi:probable rRNA maturation factor
MALKRLSKKILNGLDSEEIPASVEELSILLCEDDEIRALNRDYRGKDKATDVLSFSLLDGEEGGDGVVALGDIVISIETAARQAPRYGNDLASELLRLLIHGIHHLFGFDHEGVSKTEADRMRRSERRLFTALQGEAAALVRGEGGS